MEKFEKVDLYLSMKHAGDLPQELEAELNELMAEDEDVRMYCKKADEQFHSEEAQDVFKNGDQSTSLMHTWDKIHGHHKRVIRIRWGLSAAAILLIVLGITGLLRIQKYSAPQSIASNSSIRGVLLKLPNGETIDLSSTQGNVTLGKTVLSNVNKVLTYTTASGEFTGISTMIVPAGQDYKLTLSDGTLVWMNSATTLQFPFSFGDSREVTIKGEAFFQIAPDSKKPFIVHLPNSTIRVLGTEFNVNTYEKGVDRVALVSGAVRLDAKIQHDLRKPGYEAQVLKDGTYDLQPFDAELILSWRDGYYRFRNATLGQIKEVIPRWFGKEVILDDPSLGAAIYSGLLDRNTPLEKQLYLFKVNGKVDYYWKDGRLHFRQDATRN